MLDPVTRAIMATIEGAGFHVSVRPGEVSARDDRTGETWIVRHEGDVYAAVVALAERVGIELADG